MKIIQMSYRRIYSLGNYETETVEMTATVDPGENPREALRELVQEVQLGRRQILVDRQHEAEDR